MKYLKEFRYVYEYALAGDWDAAIEEFCGVLHRAIWWNYRCAQVLEIHYPAKKDYPAKVVEVNIDDNEVLLEFVRHYLLYPGLRVRIYIQYASGKRRRIKLCRSFPRRHQVVHHSI